MRDYVSWGTNRVLINTTHITETSAGTYVPALVFIQHSEAFLVANK